METNHQSLVEWLPGFFQQWPENVLTFNEPANSEKIDIDVDQFRAFFNRLTTPLQAVQHNVLSFDPWDIAGLKRNEVRHSSVLAWLLNPKGSHGFDAIPLNALLALSRTSKKEFFPASFMRYCRVQVETNPVGDSKNRVDVEIDADNFFLLIEVKIGAFEQDKQIERYCSDAEKKAGGRPWGVVFLTPNGRQSVSSGSNNHHISCLSWRHLAREMEGDMHKAYQEAVAVHPASPMKQIAAHAAFCFIERMHQF